MKFIHILQLIWWIVLVILLFWNPFFGFMLIIGTCVVDFIKKKWNGPFLTIVTKKKKEIRDSRNRYGF